MIYHIIWIGSILVVLAMGYAMAFTSLGSAGLP